ncbi:hypothetical protein D047_4733B, partial [Vibrio parahaemolyticus VPTS-2010_2]
ITPR